MILTFKVDPSYVHKSSEAGRWLDVERFDVGSPNHPLNMMGNLSIKPLAERRKLKAEGGIFKNWTAVVVLDNISMQGVYRRILELGGAKVEKWTLKHLADLKQADMKRLTHVISHPNMLVNTDFQEFLRKIDDRSKIHTLAYIFVGECLVKDPPPIPRNFDIRIRAIIDLLASDHIKKYLQETFAFSSQDRAVSAVEVAVSGGSPGIIDEVPPALTPGSSMIVSEDVPDDIIHCDSDDNCDLPDDLLHPDSMFSQSKRKQTSLVDVESSPKRRRVTEPQEEQKGEKEKHLDPVASLKKYAQVFMKQDSPSSSRQPRMDAWVTRSPRKGLRGEEDAGGDEDVVTLDDDDNSNSRPPVSGISTVRRSSGTHFLVQTRSGSIKTSQSSARSLTFSQVNENNSSQDSFMSAGDDVETASTFDINKIEDTAARQHVYLSGHIAAQKRIHTYRLGVGSGADFDYPLEDDNVELLPALRCRMIWNCLMSESDYDEMEEDEMDEGWLNGCELLLYFIRESVHAPAAGLWKIMHEAVKDHQDPVIRVTAYNAITECVKYHQPGPSTDYSRRFRTIYLELFSRKTPYINKWEWNPLDPWNVISDLLEVCISKTDTSNSSSVRDTKNKLKDDKDGDTLMLKLFTFIVEIDFNNWYDHMLLQDKIDLSSDMKPLIGHVLCPIENIGWSKNYQSLVQLYVKAVSHDLREADLSNLRKLVGFAAQVLQFKDRTKKSNSLKEEISRDVARQLLRLNLSERRLWAELYLLEPSWLSAQVSSEMISIQTNTNISISSSNGLRSIKETYIDKEVVSVEESTETGGPEDEEDSSVVDDSVTDPVATSTPVRPKRGRPRRNQNTESREATPAPSTVKKRRGPKINLSKTNKYGETPLHIAAKKGDLGRLEACLDTPGVDVNVADNNGYTPLAEAVANNKREAVEMLLKFTPKSYNITNYFSPSRSSSSSSVKQKVRVDLLKKNTDESDLKNPFHEAVSNDNLGIVSLLLETVAEEDEQEGESGLPSLVQLLDSKTGLGESPLDLAKNSEQMKSLLLKFSTQRNVKKEIVPKNLAKKFSGQNPSVISLRNYPVCTVMLENLVVKYISANGLDFKYSTMKNNSLENMLEAIKDDEGDLTINGRWEKTGFDGGFTATIWGKKPRFELYCDKSTVASDIKDFEKLVAKKEDYLEEKHKEKSVMHPLSNLLKSLKISM